MHDRRREFRTSVNKVGTIKFGPSKYQLPCTVIDLTPRGAGLIVASAFGVPKVFQLTVNGETGAKHCQVIWSEGRKLGVSFE
jgi:hypothetical protein